MVINGAIHDGLDAWHVLNSDLKKSLGFVTPFFRKSIPMWKHLSGDQPAKYNVMDADAAGSNMRGTVDLLKKHGMWNVYNEFICELDPVFSAMSRAGMPIDIDRRIESSKQLIERRTAVRETLNTLVPDAIKPITPKNGYVRTPADTTGLTEIVFNGIRKTVCSVCGVENPKKSHFKDRSGKFCAVCSGKWTKRHIKSCSTAEAEIRSINPCSVGSATEKLEGESRWAKVHPFIPSTKGILKYQEWSKHPIIFEGRGDDKHATTNEKALKKLIGKHPEDRFYPLCLEDREYTKLGGTYIGWFNPETDRIEGGFPVGKDGKIHGVFRHNPSTLRSSMVSPNLQNLPRGDDSEVQKWVKAMFVAQPGNIFVAADFGGIEAILVGREANSRDYVKLARSDVHSYFTAMNLIRQGVLTHADEPQLSWSEKDLKEFGQRIIKARFNAERNIGKRCIHAGNYRVGSTKLHEEYPMWFPRVKDAAQVLGFYYEVFPAIATWHEQLCLQVDSSAVVRNSFGHTHRFYQILNWTKRDNKWDWDYGDDAKRLIAFKPQSDAAFVGKRALKRCYYNYPESMARWLRLFIHDEIFTEVPIDRADEAASILQFEMEQPVPELTMDPSWGWGSCLSIASEGKCGLSWDKMK